MPQDLFCLIMFSEVFEVIVHPTLTLRPTCERDLHVKTKVRRTCTKLQHDNLAQHVFADIY